MPKVLAFVLPLLAVLLLVGCGGTSREDLAHEQVGLMGEFADALEGITDEASAKRAKPVLEKLLARMTDVGERAAAFEGDSTPKDWQEELGEEFQQVAARMVREQMRIASDPQLSEHLDALFEDFGNSIR